MTAATLRNAVPTAAPTRRTPARRRRGATLAEPLEARRLLAAGDLDGAFSGDGFATFTFSDAQTQLLEDVAVDAEGRIYASGVAFDNGTFDRQYYVARLTAKGALDDSWGDGGIVELPAPAAPSTGTGANGSVVDLLPRAGGGLYVGRADGDAGAIVVLDDAGTLDASFGTAAAPGVLSLAFRPELATLDGNVVIAAGSVGGASEASFARVVEPLGATSLDLSTITGETVDLQIADLAVSGNRAFVLADVLPADATDEAQARSTVYALAVDADGRYTGSLDATFGGDGIAELPFFELDVFRSTSLSVDSAGRPVVVVNEDDGETRVIRYAADGAIELNQRLALPGPLESGIANEAVGGVVLGDNRIVVGGYAEDDAENLDPAALALLADGRPDPSFGDGDGVRHDLGAVADITAAIALTPDGDLILAGRRGDVLEDIRDLFVARIDLGDDGAAPVEPEPTDPEPVDPEPVDPEPTDPEPVDPAPVDPTNPTDPVPSVGNVVGRTLIVNGTAGDDDIVVGLAGDSVAVRVIDGDNVDETIYDPADLDEIVINAGDGNDEVFVERLVNVPVFLFGGGGNDTLTGGAASDLLDGGAGDDSLRGGGDDDRLYGQGGNDTLLGDAGDDSLRAGLGDDSLAGDAGNDLLLPGLTTAESDTVSGGDGGDRLHYRESTANLRLTAGSTAAENVVASGDIEVVLGGSGDDVISGFTRIEGGPGNDTLTGGSSGGSALLGELGDDTLTALGTTGNFLDGGRGNDTLRSGVANDTLASGQGTDDLVDTGGANDLSFGDIQTADGDDPTVPAPGVALDLSNVDQVLAADSVYGTIIGSFVNVTGTKNDDVILGTDARNYLDGRGGADRLEGRGGFDVLVGSGQNDSLVGGDGRDLFVSDQQEQLDERRESLLTDPTRPEGDVGVFDVGRDFIIADTTGLDLGILDENDVVTGRVSAFDVGEDEEEEASDGGDTNGAIVSSGSGLVFTV